MNEQEKVTAEHLLNMKKAVKGLSRLSSLYKYFNYVERKKCKTRRSNGQEKHLYCQNCQSQYLPDSCKVRIYPRPVLTKRLTKLLHTYQFQPWCLNNKEKKKLIKFKTSTNKIVYKCLICHKYNKYLGSKMPSVPVSANFTPKILFKPNANKRRSITNSTEISLNRSLNNSFNSQTPRTSGTNKYTASKQTASAANPMNTPKSAKKKKDSSLLRQMLREEEENRQNSANTSLSAFLSSI